MARTRLHLRLRPRSIDGSSTWLSLSGPLPTKTGAQQIRRLVRCLAICSGESLRVVLSAVESEGWAEIWRSELDQIPERHLEIRLRVRRGARRRPDRDDEQLDFFGVAR